MARNFAQSLRLIWIDAALSEDGEINRADIQLAFKVSTPQASADLQAFQRLYPSQIAYDRSAKTYRLIEGRPAIYTRKQHASAFAAVEAVSEVET